jgi:hypothetical protein
MGECLRIDVMQSPVSIRQRLPLSRPRLAPLRVAGRQKETLLNVMFINANSQRE